MLVVGLCIAVIIHTWTSASQAKAMVCGHQSRAVLYGARIQENALCFEVLPLQSLVKMRLLVVVNLSLLLLGLGPVEGDRLLQRSDF